MKDTIAAIATSMGVGAISIIRISGNDAIPIVNKIFKGKDLIKVPTHTIHYGHIIDNNEILDEVLVSIMKSPKTFTTEDVVEINCHGGIITTTRVLELLLCNGCRLAEPGEFTKRAFLNGRIDLTQAEAVSDLINAKTEQNANLALSQLSGSVSNKIHELRKDLVEILTSIAVNIDYPEYEDIEEITSNKLIPKIENVLEKIKEILKQSKQGQIIKNGIKTSIIGRPNVGKSSLLNALLEEDKAIVTDIAGTTRDIVEGTIQFDGILLHMIDTAGIRETSDKIESIGVQKSLDLLNASDLVLFVLNNNEEITEEEKELLKKLENKNYIIIQNKMDLENKLIFPKEIETSKIIPMSAKNKDGINSLKKKIKEIFHLEKIETKDISYLSSARSIALLKQSHEILEKVYHDLQNNVASDMAEIDIKDAWNILGNIIGETYEEELLDHLFSKFCLGK